MAADRVANSKYVEDVDIWMIDYAVYNAVKANIELLGALIGTQFPRDELPLSMSETIEAAVRLTEVSQGKCSKLATHLLYLID